jgi:hypothetical protein
MWVDGKEEMKVKAEYEMLMIRCDVREWSGESVGETVDEMEEAEGRAGTGSHRPRTLRRLCVYNM